MDSQFRWSVEIWVYEDYYFAYNLFVKEGHRHQGLATSAMSVVCDIARCDSQDLYLRIDDNNLIPFYEGLGFVKVYEYEDGNKYKLKK